MQLAPGDSDVTEDIFVRDRQAGTTTLVSRADGPNGAKGTDPAIDASISADGGHVAFVAEDPYDAAVDDNGTQDIYTRDLQAAETTLVSREDGPAGDVGDSFSRDPDISSNGRFVAFESLATNLSADDVATVDIYLRDTQANRTILLSRATGAPGAAANAQTLDPAISGDGTITVFETTADNLDGAAPGGIDDDAVEDIYTRQADVDIVGPTANLTSTPPARSADTTATVGFTVNDVDLDLSGTECSVDGAAFAACPGPTFTTTPLPDGAHNIRVRAFDVSQNRGATQTANFTIDTTGPATQITSAPPASSTATTATVGFGSPDADATAFQCSVDGGAFAACTSPFTTPALPVGPHTVDVKATDDLGNTGAAQRASFTVTAPGGGGDPDPPAKPSNAFSFGKTELNAKKGTATLPVDVPGAGKLELEGKDVKPVSASASRASTVELGVKAKGDLAKKLKKKSKATAKVEVTFTPTGGDANTEDASVKLKLKKK